VSSGYVYILTNDAMPGVVKIGRTSREVDVRAAELWQTGVPTPFSVYAQARTCDCVDLERLVHDDLKGERVHQSREFFRIDPEVAREKLQFWVTVQVMLHFDSITAVLPGFWVDEEKISRLAKNLNASTFEFTDAMAMLTQEELLPALRRARAKRLAEQVEFLRGNGWSEEEIASVTEGCE
jgi:hypothetical protein